MKKKKWILAACLGIALVLVCCAGCSTNQSGASEVKTQSGAVTYPVKVKDDLNNEVTIESEPKRIVSLSPANTEILFALDAGSRQVGRTDYCNYPDAAQSIESIGDYNSPNVEKIISLNPDVVLATDFIDDNVRKQLENAGAKVIVFKAASIDDVEKDIVTVGQVVNKNDKAKETVEKMNADRKDIVDACKKASSQKSVFIDLGDYYSCGDGSLLGSMLTEINAKNIASGGKSDWPQLSVEQIISANPDVYISFMNSAETIKQVSGFDQLNAVKNKQLYAYGLTSEDSDKMQRPGPRIVEGLKLMAKDVYPDLVK